MRVSYDRQAGRSERDRPKTRKGRVPPEVLTGRLMPLQETEEERRRTLRRDLWTFLCIWLVIFAVAGIAILIQSN
jgi:hypothetical protein